MASPAIITVNRDSKRFSRLLREIPDPPETLFCRGNLDLLNASCFGVVGTRKLTAYGKETTQTIVRDLVRHGWVIVSGLALGIDATAHRAALDSGGRTIAVLGSGIDDETIGPKANFRLAMDILTNSGLIISEYPEKYPASDFTFPARNRIISGLSRGVLIVEADEISGSLITARHALEQNRDVFAVPGNIFAPKSIGTNKLIQKGAKLVMSSNDILEEYSENLELFPAVRYNSTNPLEDKILDFLRARGPATIDEIAAEITEKVEAISSRLAIMEIHGQIKNMNNGKFKLAT